MSEQEIKNGLLTDEDGQIVAQSRIWSDERDIFMLDIQAHTKPYITKKHGICAVASEPNQQTGTPLDRIHSGRYRYCQIHHLCQVCLEPARDVIKKDPTTFLMPTPPASLGIDLQPGLGLYGVEAPVCRDCLTLPDAASLLPLLAGNGEGHPNRQAVTARVRGFHGAAVRLDPSVDSVVIIPADQMAGAPLVVAWAQRYEITEVLS